MHAWIEQLTGFAAVAGQFLFAAIGLYALLRIVPVRQTTRWKRLAFLQWRANPPPAGWLKGLRLDRSSGSFQEREVLLAGCGFTADAGWYMLGRRIGMVACLGLAAIGLLWYGFSLSLQAQLMIGLPLLGSILLAADIPWLRSIRKLRALQMTKEIYAVSNQLLYFSDSSLHLHTKLVRCLPFTKLMKEDMERLLAEWYHDPAEALQRFKHRLGTDDGMSFVETLDALRQHESSQYYQLLRVRIGDYKDKLELAKESRKESTSYVLFVIAGIPILYTFQIFIYPWIMESQKLFQSLE
ncbi:hypothetical protein M6D81_27835 [Paenibacillus sp. J5C_2022]|uniref:hypothetical protein n=1 Tax=Paenibacillus sp. J5C2022 TaxID=2977129 RepID=UPI0021CF7AB3|nr:hypothetical protein [Paenibacillus sp. J5C2022]MCU6712514.1 hypothetical protein [Paenibacillus sp. J5C2022]